jgi:uncharacterized protein (TIGR03382 family)
LVATNLYILDWERVMMTELLSFWALVTLFLCFERFVRQPKLELAVVLAVVAFVAVMIRPFNLYLPVLLLGAALAWSFWVTEGRRYWKPVLLSAALFSLGIGGYMVANARVNGVFGLSWITNIDLFGKVLEYHLQDAPVAARYAPLQADVDRFIRNNPPYPVDPWPAIPPDPWAFVQTHELPAYGPGMTWSGGYQPVGGYARGIIVGHFGQYVANSMADAYAAWQATPWLYAVYGAAPDGTWTPDKTAIAGITGYPVFGRNTTGSHYEPTWVTALLILSTLQEGAYAFLPVLLVLLGYWLWRRRHDLQVFLLLIMLLALVSNILIAGLASYVEFYRLRAPMDWAMIMVASIVLLAGLSAIRSRVAETVAQDARANAFSEMASLD